MWNHYQQFPFPTVLSKHDGQQSMETMMKLLPPFKRAVDQVMWTDILTSFHYDKLGFYDEEFADPVAQELLLQFHSSLLEKSITFTSSLNSNLAAFADIRDRTNRTGRPAAFSASS